MKRLTLYQRLKPEVIAGLECVGNQPYHVSVNNIVEIFKSKQYYSDLTIDDVKNIIVFSGVNPVTIPDFTYGNFLFKENEWRG